jgi:tetratricopeptide (TPR) repeat protein
MTGSPRQPLATNLGLAVASLVVFAALLAALEGVLRVTGLGAPDPARASRLGYQHLVLPALEPATRPGGTPVWRSADPRLAYQSVPREKAPNTLRVAVFGGSATAGLGYGPNAAFAHQLERMLRHALPERRVEVLNLGIVALASAQVKLLVEDACAHYDPDLLVVYSGNNEFLELHAEKYARRHASWGSGALGALARTNLFRLASALAERGEPQSASQAAKQELRLTQDEIVREIRTTPEEVTQVADQYEANLDAMAQSAASHHVPLLLVTVASNWKWRGRSDLPEGWVDALLGHAAPEGAAGWEAALGALDAKLAAAAATDPERSEWLFRRGAALEALGRFAEARGDYRAAMNADPHLRRALDALNERVLRVGARRGVPVLDAVDALAAVSPHGIVGFEIFYDYVHFTPAGATRLALAIARAFEREHWVPEGTTRAAAGYASARLARLAQLESDPFEVEEWIGFGFDRARIADRDLWKYDALLADLDARIARDPRDVPALIYRGNARSFQRDGAAGAAADYRAALAAQPAQRAARANLATLLRERAT